MLQKVSSQVGRAYHKRFTMYKKFTFVKHGYLGRNERREVDSCVQDITIFTYLVEAGRREHGFDANKNHN